MQERTKTVIKLFNGKVLDVGCGLGEVAIESAKNGLDVTAFDLDSERLDVAIKDAKSQNVKIKFFKSDIFEYDSKGELYDTVYLGHVLEHMESPKLVIDALLKLLNDDGKLIISIPAGFAHYDKDHKYFFCDDRTLEMMAVHWINYLIPQIVLQNNKIVGVESFINTIKDIKYKLNPVQFSDSKYPSMDFIIEIKKGEKK